MSKEKITTISISGDGDHTSVVDFATKQGFSVKVWGKRGPGKNKSAAESSGSN